MGVGCIRPWLRIHADLDRVVPEGIGQVWRQSKVCNIKGAPSTPGYLLALLHTLHPGHGMHLVGLYSRICFGTGINDK